MPTSRLSQLEKNLGRLRDQLHGIESAQITAPQAHKVQHQQMIEDIRAEMQPFEQEYWEIVAQQSGEIEVTEPEAEVIIAEIVEQHTSGGQGQSYPEPVLEILQKIYEKVNEPGTTAAAKLKATLSLLPPFIGIAYETELDTENTLRKYLPPLNSLSNPLPRFTKWVQNAAKKLQPSAHKIEGKP